jgi:hypothetical protein
VNDFSKLWLTSTKHPAISSDGDDCENFVRHGGPRRSGGAAKRYKHSAANVNCPATMGALRMLVAKGGKQIKGRQQRNVIRMEKEPSGRRNGEKCGGLLPSLAVPRNHAAR